MKTEWKMETRLGRTALAVVVGAASALAILWLIAWAVARESLPDVYLLEYAGAALFLGALVAGACVPAAGGRRLRNGIAVGGALAVILILSKLLAEQEDVFGIQTWISVILCLAGGMAGSCIFHKKLQRTSKNRKHKQRRK
ncbi:MAG: TIGR04086 family membrane protein [Oscillospiraceae bacterium]|nr:TIGR04086 family membrane protein [Oscillospiraceae bacterium]